MGTFYSSRARFLLLQQGKNMATGQMSEVIQYLRRTNEVRGASILQGLERFFGRQDHGRNLNELAILVGGEFL
jgi:hypothetical protein